MKRLRLPASPEHRAGAIILFVMAVYVGVDSIVLAIADYASLWQIMATRSGFGIILLLLLARWQNYRLRPKRLLPAVLRTVFLAAAMMLYFGSIPFQPIAVIGAGLFTSPVFVLIFSAVLFGQRIGWRRILAVCLGAAGTWYIMEVGEAAFSLKNAIPVLAGALYAMSSLATRHWCAEEPPLALALLSMMVMGGVASLVASGFWLFGVPVGLVQLDSYIFSGWRWIPSLAIGLILIQGIGSTLAIALHVRAYQMAETSFVAVYEYIFIIYALLVGWLFWGQSVNPAQLAGIGLILAAGLVITVSAARHHDADAAA